MVVGGIVLAVLALGVAWLWLRKPSQGGGGASPDSAAQRASKGGAVAPPGGASDSLSTPVPAAREVPPALEQFTLLGKGDSDAATMAQVGEICAVLADPHPVQQQLASGLDAPEELMDMVSSDAGLTASVLRTVNSAAFALAAPITSVQHAITYLGVSVVKGLVAQAAVAERIPVGSPEQEAALTRVWRSACLASACAQVLGKELGLARPSILATRALFSNLGDVAVISARPAASAWYQEGVSIVERVTAQQEAGLSNTAIVGAMLARRWNLPVEIASSIEGSLLPLAQAPDQLGLQGGELQYSILTFLVGRIADHVTYHGLRDMGDLPLTDDEALDLFYLPQHLEAAGLGRVIGLLGDPAMRRKLNRQLELLAG